VRGAAQNPFTDDDLHVHFPALTGESTADRESLPAGSARLTLPGCNARAMDLSTAAPARSRDDAQSKIPDLQ
jgi:hypothetical protein